MMPLFKLQVLLLICLTGLSCTNGTLQNEGRKDAIDKKSAISKTQKLAAIARYDSLNKALDTFQGLENKDLITQYLVESLSIARQLNNDSWLATTYFKLGGHFDGLTNYALSIDYFYKAFELYQKLGNYQGAAVSLNNMSWAYIQAFDFKKGIELALKGITMMEKVKNAEFKIRLPGFLYNNISIAYSEMGLLDSALLYNELSSAIYPKIKAKRLNHYAWILAQFGNIYTHKKDHKRAEEYFQKVLVMKDTSATSDATVFAISRYCHLLNSQLRFHETINIGMQGIEIAKNLAGERYMIDIADELRYAYEKLYQTDSAFMYSKLATRLRDSIFNTQKSIQLQNLTFSREMKDKEMTYALEKAKAEERIASEKRVRNIFIFGFVLVMLSAGLFLYQRNKIRAGKLRSDNLLLNILPEEVAEELKTTGTAEARHFDEVTVLFTDFKDFTQISEKMTPKELVEEIHTCFKAFDGIIDKHGIEKIKTIGDSYMCAGGLPVANETHAENVVNAGLEIQQFIQSRMAERSAAGKDPFQIRIGIHTGPVVAGIVGIKKFAYDIWGDTVNTASRMESSGEVGKVNISETTYTLVKDKFKCTPRGRVVAKHKGEMEMYFVEGRI